MKNIKCLILGLSLLSVCISCNKTPKQDLIANYELKQLEINQLYTYVNDITTSDKYFKIEFESDKKIAYFFVTIKRIDPLTSQSSYTNIVADGDYNRGFIGNRDLEIESQSVDNLLSKLGWTRNELNTLKQKLDNANCISVESGECTQNIHLRKIESPMTIGYKRVGLGMYFYKIFSQVLSDSLKNKYNDGCTYIFYKDNIVLEYGGGLIGRQCF
jgi:hypothetical protein